MSFFLKFFSERRKPWISAPRLLLFFIGLTFFPLLVDISIKHYRVYLRDKVRVAELLAVVHGETGGSPAESVALDDKN